ncbi:MAG: hypothetical protein WC082_12905 [Victivallales bacterium]|jgi:hypothetical protein|nr:hypothetical protein [Victivallaceae bacterium]
MSRLKNLFRQLEHQSAFQAGYDGFPSGELRQAILKRIKPVKLNSHPHGNYRDTRYSDEEKLKIEYLTAVGKTGAIQAKKYIADKILLPTGHFLCAIIELGTENLGREIARSYASEIYPELRRMRLAGEADINFPQAEPDKKMSYGFTVETDRDIFDLGPIQESGAAPGNDIYYDDIGERHIETFVFASIEDADAAHWNWQRFLEHQTPRPPVKYALRIETDSLERLKIGSIIHVDPFEKNRSEITGDGSAVEWNICASLAEAETLRLKKLDESRGKTPGAASELKLPSSKQKGIQKAEIPRPHREISAVSQKQIRNKNFSITK